MSTFNNIKKSNVIAGLNRINKKSFELIITCKTSMKQKIKNFTLLLYLLNLYKIG